MRTQQATTTTSISPLIDHLLAMPRVLSLFTCVAVIFGMKALFVQSASILQALEVSINTSSYISIPPTSGAINTNMCLRNTARFSHDWIADEVVRIQDLHISMASTSRLVTTVWLAWAALHLPGGDFVETGVWKGGSSVLMLKVLLTFDSCKRTFWAFDTFNGLPKLVKFDKTGTLAKGKAGKFKATRDEYVGNLQDYGAYDASVVSVTPGMFRVTLPVSKVAHIAFLRLDGKLYEATRDSLENLYDRVIPGGYIYVNDYEVYNGCKKAVDDFRQERNLTGVVHAVPDTDWRGNPVQEAVWWVK